MPDIVYHSIEWFAGVFLPTVVFTQLSHVDKRIVNNEILYRKEQLATRINTI